MITKKSPEDIQKLARAGHLLGTILDELVARAVVGATGKELDQYAKDAMSAAGADPAFLGYGEPPFPGTICVSINAEVVHGIPRDIPFVNGDIVGIDAGLWLDGVIVDAARTVGIGEISEENKHLMSVTKKALEIGIAQADIGNTTGDIGHAIQTYVESEKLEVVRALVGHGVGYDLHEEPQVPNFGNAGSGVKLEEGMVIAIEPMVTYISPEVITAADGWSIVALSGKPSAHEEHTVAITKDGPIILTTSHE
ncbi:MAG TPA: type I methionyl aminopeptidase [Candidatus Andersenbacteria bacterium]|nr:type I methionyl aminopeptidase [Candidatus Andersenbacteria bacterium]